MQTANKISFAEFTSLRETWIKQNCVTDGDHQRCKACNSLIMLVGVYYSVHDARLAKCLGTGRILKLAIPYCPRCEAEPEPVGCLHEHPSQLGNAAKARFN